VARERDLSWLKDLRVLGLSFICGLVGLVVGGLVVGKLWHLPPNYGDIASWFLVVLAAAGGWFTLNQLGLQREQLKEQEKTSAKQADALSFRPGNSRSPLTSASGKPRNESKVKHPR
jgi:hypothetical protein